MFELNYKITDGDMKAVNKKIMIFYFALYFAVAVIGIAIGIVAVVLRPQTLMLVLGIILLILGAILLACSILLLIAPKNFVISAVVPSDEDRTVIVDDKAIKVDSDTVIPLEQVSKVKAQDGMLVVTVAKNTVLLVKDAITSGQSLDELKAHLSAFHGVMPIELVQSPDEQADNDGAAQELADENPSAADNENA